MATPARTVLLALLLAPSCTAAEGPASPAVTTVAAPALVAPAPPASSVPTTVPTAGPSPTTQPAEAPAPAPTADTAAPSPGQAAQVISRGDQDRRVVALTFDAGADTGFAADILDTLAAERVPASFGITGAWAEANPHLVSRMARESHQIINHTWSHSSFTGLSATPAVRSRADRIDELERTDALVRDLTGRSTRPWFRPPFGDFDDSVNADVAAAGYRYNVLWTVDSLGWRGLSAADITARCLDRAVPGAILLFHVGSQSQDAAALSGIVSALRAAGYGFATVAGVVGP